MKMIARGGFNTGRLYRAEGQRIFWAQRDDGWLYFNDRDRMVSGWIQRDGTLPLDRPVSPGWLMAKYDAGNFDFYPERGLDERPPEAPEGFDYGPMLRI